jgi:hypothetical protein
MLLRSESRLGAELPDFFTIQLPGEWPTPCFAMIMIMDNGKTNRMGRLVRGHHEAPESAALHHGPHGVLPLLPMERRRRELWYELHLLKGEHATKKMAYDTQLDWINKMFTGANVTSLKKTHAGRSQGAKHAELKGVNEGQIRRAGCLPVARREDDTPLTTSWQVLD